MRGNGSEEMKFQFLEAEVMESRVRNRSSAKLVLDLHDGVDAIFKASRLPEPCGGVLDIGIRAQREVNSRFINKCSQRLQTS